VPIEWSFESDNVCAEMEKKNRHFIVFLVIRLGVKAEEIHSLYWAGQSVHVNVAWTQVGN
jgi:hypothetical protein